MLLTVNVSEPSFGVLCIIGALVVCAPLETDSERSIRNCVVAGILQLIHVTVACWPLVHVSPPFGEVTFIKGVALLGQLVF